jgi:hypothetical protein
LKYNKISFILHSVTVLLFILVISVSCSTRKNTGANRAYHNLTSRFNVNFNGKEALKGGEEEYKNICNDNYISTLPIFVYPPKEDLSPIYPSMDRVIEKASKSIYKHSMFFKGKEYVKPIDDAYLMMGKAYFYKQDYVQAQRIFNYIVTTHKNGNCIEEAMIWNARCAMQQNYFTRAQEIISEAQYYVQPKKSKKLNVQYAMTAADYQLRAPDGDVETAINFITDVLNNKPDKATRARMNFILGQLYEEMERSKDAHEAFMKVIKKSPSYEMEFNARMHLSTNYDGTPSRKDEILKELNKMLKEEKNADFRDQIYYSISEIARVDQDTATRINNLALSVSSYKDNDFQRTHSSLKLAEIYFQQEQYPKAKAYYDTATLSLPKNYPNYASIMKKTKILTELVDNLQVVFVQDSLQRIAKMGEKERDRWVKEKVAEFKREKQRKEKEEADKMAALQNALGYANVNPNINNNNSGKWYFYNSTLMSAGKTEFLRRWGSRKLEDNWRISNKQQLSFEDMVGMNNPSEEADTTEYDENGNPILKRETDPEQERFYTQDLPLTAGAIDTSNQLIANSLFQAAIIYLDLLNDRERGIETLEKFYARFQNHELTPSTLYLLYLNYQALKNNKYETPKNIILTKYAETDYARLIREPDYYEKLAEKTKEMERKYEAVYQQFMAKQWQQTIASADAALAVCPDSVLNSKFAYLRAIAVGQVQGETALKTALQNIIVDYKGMEVEELARILLLNFAEPELPAKKESKDSLIEPVNQEQNYFTFAPNDWHYVTLIVNVHKLSVMELKNQISDFNKAVYSLQNFNLNSFYITQDEQIVTVSRFKNKETALDYYYSFTKNDKFKSEILAKNIIIFPISAGNYSTFYKEKASRPLYEKFFKEKYLNEK